jgi:COP9 signalosome complex subunit 7
LPALDAVATKKLKHLTLVTLSARHGQQLGYELLKSELDMESLRELEDLVLDAIYQGDAKKMMRHHYDQKNKHSFLTLFFFFR